MKLLNNNTELLCTRILVTSSVVDEVNGLFKDIEK